ncbi:uncharacterized protein LOC123475845 [Daphnia magna]|uniref:uncharacterized protein LOC123475845 n=1 Tax=Daphnia magna TaxID=35525 RepID=UPI001E1BD983|nr:uncharacterized protein LOC123475845 [Daphnia magna]
MSKLQEHEEVEDKDSEEKQSEDDDLESNGNENPIDNEIIETGDSTKELVVYAAESGEQVDMDNLFVLERVEPAEGVISKTIALVDVAKTLIAMNLQMEELTNMVLNLNT